MKLSIIIVSFNTKALTVDCIHSIYKHQPAFPFEIIVVDNASTDGSVESLQAIKRQNIHLILNDRNRGFAAANNQAMDQAQGEYVLLLNSDTIIVNQCIAQLISFAEAHADAGVVAPRLLNKDKSTQPSIYRLPTISRAIAQYWLGKRGVLDKYSMLGSNPVVVESVVGAAFLITPKALKLVGKLDSRYFMYFEDLDYCRRVALLGLKTYYLPETTLIHLHGASGGKGVSSLLIESSKKYFGTLYYYAYTFVLWSGQKFRYTK